MRITPLQPANHFLTMMYSISALALAVSALSASDAFVPKNQAFGLSRLSSSAVTLKAEIRGPTEKAEGAWLRRATMDGVGETVCCGPSMHDAIRSHRYSGSTLTRRLTPRTKRADRAPMIRLAYCTTLVRYQA
jgi:hypothetical protein